MREYSEHPILTALLGCFGALNRRGTRALALLAVAVLVYGAAIAWAQEASIKVLVNDAPISDYDIDQRARFLAITTQQQPSPELKKQATEMLVDELLQMVASRLALDTRRITITFDSGKDFDRQQIARMYRVARVISHVATNGKVVIEADVPRRFIERLTTPLQHEESRAE